LLEYWHRVVSTIDCECEVVHVQLVADCEALSIVVLDAKVMGAREHPVLACAAQEKDTSGTCSYTLVRVLPARNRDVA